MKIIKVFCAMCLLFFFLSSPFWGAEIGDCECTTEYGCSIFKGYDSYNMEIWEHCTSCPSSGGVSSSEKSSDSKSLSAADLAYAMTRIHSLTKKFHGKLLLGSAAERSAFYNILRNNPDLTKELQEALTAYTKAMEAHEDMNRIIASMPLKTVDEIVRHNDACQDSVKDYNRISIIAYGTLAFVTEICAKDPALDSVRQVLEDILPEGTDIMRRD